MGHLQELAHGKHRHTVYGNRVCQGLTCPTSSTWHEKSVMSGGEDTEAGRGFLVWNPYFLTANRLASSDIIDFIFFNLDNCRL